MLRGLVPSIPDQVTPLRGSIPPVACLVAGLGGFVSQRGCLVTLLRLLIAVFGRTITLITDLIALITDRIPLITDGLALIVRPVPHIADVVTDVTDQVSIVAGSVPLVGGVIAAVGCPIPLVGDQHTLPRGGLSLRQPNVRVVLDRSEVALIGGPASLAVHGPASNAEVFPLVRGDTPAIVGLDSLVGRQVAVITSVVTPASRHVSTCTGPVALAGRQIAVLTSVSSSALRGLPIGNCVPRSVNGAARSQFVGTVPGVHDEVPPALHLYDRAMSRDRGALSDLRSGRAAMR